MINRLLAFKSLLVAFTLFGLIGESLIITIICLSLALIFSGKMFTLLSIFSILMQYQSLLGTLQIGPIEFFGGLEVVICLFIVIPILIANKIFKPELRNRGIIR